MSDLDHVRRTVRTLPELVEYRCRTSPDTVAVHFADEVLTWREFDERSGAVASWLIGKGVCAGDRVVLPAPNGLEFFPCFYGIIRAGAVAVPVFPKAGFERHAKIARLSGAVGILTPEDLSDEALGRARDLAAGAGAWVDSLPTALAGGARATLTMPDPGALAFLQYTSGSTGDPKGVMLTHRNLMDNSWQAIDRLRFDETEVIVSWMPVYHDMGLIVHTICPFLIGGKLFLMPADMSRVETWIRLMSDQRATYTGAPDFALRTVLRRIRKPGEYDLSSLRSMINAAEPVRAGTVRQFEELFGLKNVVVAGYGLAEATVTVSLNWPGTEMYVDDRGLVAVGPPAEGVEVRIVDEAGAPVTAGTVGEIQVRSIANCKGYWNNPEATAALFTEDGYIRTGDLGYQDPSERLFIVGRIKNVIFSGGRTIANQEIEELVDADGRVRLAAAVGIDLGGVEGEQVHLFVELRPGNTSPEARDDVTIDLVARVHEGLGFRPARVHLLKARSIPKTRNDKLQHAELKRLYETGELAATGRILGPVE